ncbi:MAG: iron complex outermembrane receptor protein [Chitinophagales bacterium]|jgi:iron complex outermembrane receptor protein
MKAYVSFLFCLFLAYQSTAQLTLSGRVINNSDNTELMDCMLYVDQDSKPYFTLDKGSFSIPNLSPGSHSLRIVKEGYDELKRKVDLQKDEYLLLEMYPKGTGPEDAAIYKSLFTDEVIVKATRANKVTPTTKTTIDAEELAKENLGQDLTYLLKHEQSVVSFSDGGNGIGYTAMRIRGTDMSRINFTINGIPYNDPESQGVFSVNIGDIASSIKDIQIQRGVGSSTNGAAAFGASVNLNTNTLNKKPYVELNNSFGSFASMKNTLKLGTGLLKEKFTVDARLSHIKTDGYIDRARAKLWSYYLSGAYYGENTILRFNHFSGSETTYQAWNGIDGATLETDRTFNISGTDFLSTDVPYDNEIDQYKQDHYQLFVSQQIKDNWVANVGLFYIKGKGYFEQFKVQSKLANYGLDNVIQGTDTITRTDLVRRRWLDNDFYGATFSVNYQKHKKLDFTLGGAWNQYDGIHFGEVIWAEYASNGSLRDRYYENNGQKTDFNIYAKANYYFTKKIVGFADMQFRRVSYNVSGIDNDQRYLFQDLDYNFFNPKVGLSYLLNTKSTLYTSFAVANREPTRNDFIDNDEKPEHETMYDLELGYNYESKYLRVSTNYYYMHYKNQLVLNGALNDVGSTVRINVDKSYRTGIETAVGMDVAEIISLDANATWSVNEIRSFEDESLVKHDKTKISYSPQWIGGLQFGLRPIKGLSFSISSKFVGKQFLDNTSTDRLSIDKYRQNDMRIAYTFHTEVVKDVEFSLLLNNFTNREIVANAYVYAGEAYFFPQAKFNFMAGVNLRF